MPTVEHFMSKFFRLRVVYINIKTERDKKKTEWITVLDGLPGLPVQLGLKNEHLGKFEFIFETPLGYGFGDKERLICQKSRC